MIGINRSDFMEKRQIWRGNARRFALSKINGVRPIGIWKMSVKGRALGFTSGKDPKQLKTLLKTVRRQDRTKIIKTVKTILGIRLRNSGKIASKS